MRKRINLHPVPADTLLRLTGLVTLGGDALEDSETLYDLDDQDDDPTLSSLCILGERFTAIIEREGNGFVSFCPELDVASQGDTAVEAHKNLREAVELLLETAPAEEIAWRLAHPAMLGQPQVG
jgi:predicted RNase H-like HicB family nuclease